jgi:hypothetical protein
MKGTLSLQVPGTLTSTHEVLGSSFDNAEVDLSHFVPVRFGNRPHQRRSLLSTLVASLLSCDWARQTQDTTFKVSLRVG